MKQPFLMESQSVEKATAKNKKEKRNKNNQTGADGDK